MIPAERFNMAMSVYWRVKWHLVLQLLVKYNVAQVYHMLSLSQYKTKPVPKPMANSWKKHSFNVWQSNLVCHYTFKPTQKSSIIILCVKDCTQKPTWVIPTRSPMSTCCILTISSLLWQFWTRERFRFQFFINSWYLLMHQNVCCFVSHKPRSGSHCKHHTAPLHRLRCLFLQLLQLFKDTLIHFGTCGVSWTGGNCSVMDGLFRGKSFENGWSGERQWIGNLTLIRERWTSTNLTRCPWTCTREIRWHPCKMLGTPGSSIEGAQELSHAMRFTQGSREYRFMNMYPFWGFTLESTLGQVVNNHQCNAATMQVYTAACNNQHPPVYCHTSSTAQGGGRSFKIGHLYIRELGCCESRMAKRIHWWTERWLEVCFLSGCNGCRRPLVGHLTSNCWM